MPDVNVKCEDCDQDFVITVKQQEYYANTGYTLPTRCDVCEQKHRDNRAAERANRKPAKKKRRF